MESWVSDLLASLEKLCSDFLNVRFFVTTLKLLEDLVIWIPTLVALIFSFQLSEVHVEAFICSDGLAEVEVHFGIETISKTLLLANLIVVKVSIEVWDLFISNITGSHAVSEHNSSGSIEVHVLLMDVSALRSNSTNTHGLFCGMHIAV